MMAFSDKVLGTAKKLLAMFGMGAQTQVPLLNKGDGLVKDWEKKIAYLKCRALVYEVQRYTGLTEEGPNKGQMIQRFQKAVDGVASGESYCLGGLFYSIDNVDEATEYVFEKVLSVKSKLFRTEHVLTCWNKTPIAQRITVPFPGCLIIYSYWANGVQTGQGHVELFLSPLEGPYCYAFGFNTSPPAGKDEAVVREGEGCYIKKRDYTITTGRMRVEGFLRIW